MACFCHIDNYMYEKTYINISNLSFINEFTGFVIAILKPRSIFNQKTSNMAHVITCLLISGFDQRFIVEIWSDDKSKIDYIFNNIQLHDIFT